MITNKKILAALSKNHIFNNEETRNSCFKFLLKLDSVFDFIKKEFKKMALPNVPLKIPIPKVPAKIVV